MCCSQWPIVSTSILVSTFWMLPLLNISNCQTTCYNTSLKRALNDWESHLTTRIVFDWVRDTWWITSRTHNSYTDKQKIRAQRPLIFKNHSKIYISAESLTWRLNNMSSPVRADRWWVYIWHEIKNTQIHSKSKTRDFATVFVCLNTVLKGLIKTFFFKLGSSHTSNTMKCNRRTDFED